MIDLEKKTKILAEDLVFELNKSLGFRKDGILQSILKPIVWKPMLRFSELATQFDYRVVQEGFQKASAWFISHFVDRVRELGVENLPTEGPLVVAANHPGAYDSLVITSRIPRDDVKIISSDIPFVKKLEGGALLVFARGTLEPDPAFLPGSEEELPRWTSSLGLFLKNVPQAKLAIAMISGVLSSKYINHPSTIFRKGRVNKQRLSEFCQVMHQLMVPGKLMVSPNLSFAPTLTLDELGGGRDIHKITEEIIHKAQEQLEFHCKNLLPADLPELV